MCWDYWMKSKSANSSSEENEAYIAEVKDFKFSSKQLTELIEAILSKGAVFRFRAKGASMSPFLKDGDVLSIAPCEPSSLRCGNIVAYCQKDENGNERLVVHRIIQQKESGFILKGDNLSVSDQGIVCPDQILGKVIQAEREGAIVKFSITRADRAIAGLSRFGILRGVIQPVRYIKACCCYK